MKIPLTGVSHGTGTPIFLQLPKQGYITACAMGGEKPFIANGKEDASRRDIS